MAWPPSAVRSRERAGAEWLHCLTSDLPDRARDDPQRLGLERFMQITLTATGPKEFQVYDLYTNPMMPGWSATCVTARARSSS